MYIGKLQWLDLESVPGVLDWLAFILGGAGIAFTIYQLLRSKSALESARDALIDTRATLMKNQLAAILPKHRGLVDKIENEIQNNNRKLLKIYLDQYILDSTEMHELVISQKDHSQEIADDIVMSLDEASTMRAALFGSPDENLSELVDTQFSHLKGLVTKIYQLEIQICNDPREETGKKKKRKRRPHARH